MSLSNNVFDRLRNNPECVGGSGLAIPAPRENPSARRNTTIMLDNIVTSATDAPNSVVDKLRRDLDIFMKAVGDLGEDDMLGTDNLLLAEVMAMPFLERFKTPTILYYDGTTTTHQNT